MKNIYLDFDGTIIDSSTRLYEVYKSILIEFHCPYLSKSEYWSLKRERQPRSAILSRTASNELTSEYISKFLQRIESENFLKFDRLINGVEHTLSRLKHNNRLILVTLRRVKENLYRELKNLAILDFFEEIFADFKEGVNSWEITAASIKRDLKFNKDNSIIVGDTEDTALAGKELEISSFLVLSGIRSEDFLKKYQPCYILKDLNELPRYLSEVVIKNC